MEYSIWYLFTSTLVIVTQNICGEQIVYLQYNHFKCTLQSLSLCFCVMLDQMEVEPQHTQNPSALTAKLTLISMNHSFK